MAQEKQRPPQSPAEKLLQQAEAQKTLDELDLLTLFASAGITSHIGLQHYQLSHDTRLTLEARKAHRFVAANCEEATKKILMLSTAPPKQIDAWMKDITQRILDYDRSLKNAAENQPVPESKKQ